jgi:hypothetical protein
MKYIKYITMVLLVGLFAACSDKDVTYDMTKADGANQAYVQIFNMAPIANNAANYAYRVDINGYEYQNDCAAVLQTRNGIPGGGTNLFFTVNAGTLNIKLHKKETVTYEKDGNGLFYKTYLKETIRVNPGDPVYFVPADNVVKSDGSAAVGEMIYNGENIVGKVVRDSKLNALERIVEEPYYEGNTTLEGGKRYQVVIYDLAKNPIAVEMDPIPAMGETKQQFGDVTDVIGVGFNSKFYNFLFESEGVPYPHKLQAYYKNQETGEFNVPAGGAFGFGEACKWTTIPLKKSVYNSSGYARMDYTFHVIDANGNDQGQLTYVKANGSSAAWTDYWSSYYVGRAYMHFIIGVRDGSGITMVNTRWTSQ